MSDHYETGNASINIFDIQNNMFKIYNDCAQSSFNVDASLIILGYWCQWCIQDVLRDLTRTLITDTFSVYELYANLIIPINSTLINALISKYGDTYLLESPWISIESNECNFSFLTPIDYTQGGNQVSILYIGY